MSEHTTVSQPPGNFHYVLIVAARVDKSDLLPVVKISSSASICLERQ